MNTLSPDEHVKYWYEIDQERIAEVARLRSQLENSPNANPVSLTPEQRQALLVERNRLQDQLAILQQERARIYRQIFVVDLLLNDGEPKPQK